MTDAPTPGTPRAAVIVTGTEVLGGWVTDRNGPWLARRLGALGVRHVTTITVGDRPEDLLGALEDVGRRGIDLVLTSGGLGPTEDDLTTETVAAFTGRPLALDEALESRIWERVLAFVRRRGGEPMMDLDALRAANRKQALVPAGAAVLEPLGTAPGLVVPGEHGVVDGAASATDEAAPARGRTTVPTVVVLPGPPRELEPMWLAVEDGDLLDVALRGAVRQGESTLRVFGIHEAQLADLLRDARRDGVPVDRLEVTTCAHRGELEVVTRWDPSEEASAIALEEYIAATVPKALYSRDGRGVADHVLDLARDLGWTAGTAESCTGGLVAAALTDVPGSSDVVHGGVVAYDDDIKRRVLRVDGGDLAEHGAVSAAVAQQMARGALDALHVDIAVSTTGVAGPGGGTEAKPVGTVFVAVATRDGRDEVRHISVPGDRASVRERTVTSTLHLLRRVLADALAERGR
ncbi:MAG: nicotinamide-nucleotide amidohydrolase family protein [Solirubrobacteraceae bacterium]